MMIGWMVHVHSIKFPFRVVLMLPIPIFDISVNIFLWFIGSPGFNIVNSFNITLVRAPSFSFGVGLGYVASSSLKCFKDRGFFCKLKLVVSAITLALFGSALVHYFAAIVPLYFSVLFLMKYPPRTSILVSQSSLLLSMKIFIIYFGPYSRSLNILLP